MSEPRARVRLQDMLNEIAGIRAITANLSFAESEDDDR